MASERFASFEVYVEAEHGGWANGGKCDACLRKAPRLTAGISRGTGLIVGAGNARLEAEASDAR